MGGLKICFPFWQYRYSIYIQYSLKKVQLHFTDLSGGDFLNNHFLVL